MSDTKMAPGRELDAALAEFMGWRRVTDGDDSRWWPGPRIVEWAKAQGCVAIDHFPLWEFSTDPAASAELRAWLRENEWDYRVKGRGKHSFAAVMKRGSPWPPDTHYPTEAGALALAAYAALTAAEGA